MADERVERFPGTGGLAMPVTAGLLGVLLVGIALVDGPDLVDAPILAGCLLGGVVVWLVFRRPAVRVEAGETLVLTGALSETRIPLAAVERVALTRMLVVQVGERRFVSTSLSRTLRSAMSSGGMAAERRDRQALSRGDHDALGQKAYPDFVEQRLTTLAADARDRHGVRLLSSEQESWAAGVRREWSRVPLVALAGGVVALALSVLLL